MAISEKIELLGKGLYDGTGIPDTLTLTNIPTASELEYVGSEEFDETMVSKILPSAIEEKIDVRQLLEIDFQWICRCLRILNYGPYHTTNAVFCGKCGKTSYGEFSVDLNTVDCKPLPENFKNDIVISKDEFIDFDQDIHIKLPTIQQVLNAYKDKAFQSPTGEMNRDLARMCYMISAIGNKDKLTPVEIRMTFTNKLSDADYRILKDVVTQLTDYGLRAGGRCSCPKCGNNEAAFLALVDDRFFRPTLGDLRKWKDDRRKRDAENVSGSKKATV